VTDSVIKWNNRARVWRATREGGRQMRDESTCKGGARPPVVVQAVNPRFSAGEGVAGLVGKLVREGVLGTVLVCVHGGNANREPIIE
jgi:hypothetical protein